MVFDFSHYLPELEDPLWWPHGLWSRNVTSPDCVTSAYNALQISSLSHPPIINLLLIYTEQILKWYYFDIGLK